ncbi:MAG: hypothetical protein IIA90_01240 [Chloroflexi bacterium]|nr:hypothetical protein [Chloroflexota bacterium]
MDGPSQAERNAMAQRLISRNKLAEALDLLNETIRQDQRFAATFENRAVVFEALGMHPQAQADRRRAAALRAALPASAPSLDSTPAEPPDSGSGEWAAPAVALPGDETSEGDEAAPPESTAEAEDANDGLGDVAAAPDASGEPPDEPPPPVIPSYPPPPRKSIGSALLRAAGVVVFALGTFSIAGGGIYFALNAVGDSADDSVTPSPTEAPAAASDEPGDDGDGGVAGAATDVPATMEEALSGSPYSFSHLEDAWHAQALAVSIGEISESVTGFGEPAVDITLTGNGATMELSVLIYSSAEAKDTEWTLGVGPEPKVDGELPAGSSVWYNANAIVVVRVSAPALRQDALDGFLAVGEGVGESADEE